MRKLIPYNYFQEMILKSIKKNFYFFILGAVQVALIPMFRSGLDTLVLAILRDKRHKDFSNSLLGIIESNLANDLHILIAFQFLWCLLMIHIFSKP